MIQQLFFKYLTFSLLIASSFSCRKKKDFDTVDDYEKFVQDEMEDEHIPAISVLLFKDNSVTYEKNWGYSNLENKTELADDHLFLLASISKVVTATALLQLYDVGHFSLNDPINQYLPFDVNIPDENTEITFKMLLTHTSGIADGSSMDDEYYYGEDPTKSLRSFLESYLVPGGYDYIATENFHDFEPGTDHEYSNIGNALLALLVEEISGVDFNTYCKQNIFHPLGMTNTYWRLDEINQTIVTPYNYEHKEYSAVDHYTFTDYPNGGLRSTAKDLFVFLKAFTNEGSSNNYQLLSKSTVALMSSPQIPSIDREVGLHLFIMDTNNNIWGHDGGEEGVATIMGFNPETKVGAIVLCNQGEAEISNIFVEGYKIGLSL